MTDTPPSSIRHPLRAILPSLLGIALFVVALLALHHELRGHTFHEVFLSLQAISQARLILAAVLVVLVYSIQTLYDTISFRFIRHTIAYRSVALASFLGHAIANNIGFAALMSGSVRFRYYLARGVSPGQILFVVAFGSLTFWLGFGTVCMVNLLFFPPPIPPFFHLPLSSLQPVGFVLLILLVLYLVWSATHQRSTFKFFGYHFRVAPLRITFLQILTASSEWLVGASILYVLLPPSLSISYGSFLSIFLLAQIMGLLSQVPGGIGVFESIVLALMPGAMAVPEAIASILVYRIFYNLAPLTVATGIMGYRELLHRRDYFNATPVGPPVVDEKSAEGMPD